MNIKQFTFSLFLLAALALTSCKNSFDTLLASTDNAEKMTSAMKYYEEGDYYKAQMLFEQIMPFYRGTKELEDIYFKYAYSHFHLNKFILANYYFKNFTTTFPNSSFTEEAMYMTAFSSHKLSPIYRLDQTETLQAIDEFQRFINAYPYSDKVGLCNGFITEMRAKLEEKAFQSAELYYQLAQYQSATHAFENLLKDYPDTNNAELIRYQMVLAAYKFAQNSVEAKRAERYEATVSKCVEFKEFHANSKYEREIENIRQASLASLR